LNRKNIDVGESSPLMENSLLMLMGLKAMTPKSPLHFGLTL
jgi:hypothetical protein